MRLGSAFWRFWCAAVLANVGDGIRVAAFPLLAATLTSDPIAVAAVGAAQGVPWLLTGLWAGVLADRRGGRALIAAADAVRFVALAVLTAAVAFAVASIALVVVAAVVVGVGETVRDTAAQAVTPRLVPGPLLERANARLVAGEVVGNEFAGPPIGAALFVAGAAIPFAVNGAALALAVMLVLTLPLSLAARAVAHSAADGGSVGGGVLAGLRWLSRQRALRALTVSVAAVAAADNAWFAIFVLYARDRLSVGAVGFGWLLAIGAAGGVSGSMLAGRFLRDGRHRVVLACTLAVTAGVPVLLVLAPSLWAAVLVVVVTSGAFAVFNVAAVSLRQRVVPEHLLGRVTATSRTLALGGAGVGALIGGALAAGAGATAPFLFSGVIAVFATAVWWIGSRPDGGRLAQH